MALVERLMHDASESDSRWMSVHLFFAACLAIEQGIYTVAQVKSYYQMTAADEVDFDALIALMPGAGQPGPRALFIEKIHAAFILAENKTPLFSTPSEVRARLGI